VPIIVFPDTFFFSTFKGTNYFFILAIDKYHPIDHMKISFLFFILILGSLGLSAQDTIPAPAPGQGKGKVEYDRHVHDTIYIRDGVSSKKPITERYLLHLRNKAIILSSVGGGLIIGGTSLVVAGNRQDASGDNVVSHIAGGSLLIVAGGGITLAGVGTWIYYGVKRHKFKQQELDGTRPYYQR
jgi:hypothetical protein